MNSLFSLSTRTSASRLLSLRAQKQNEAKRREELLRMTDTDRPNTHIQMFLDHEQNELRHHNRLSRANDGKRSIRG